MRSGSEAPRRQRRPRLPDNTIRDQIPAFKERRYSDGKTGTREATLSLQRNLPNSEQLAQHSENEGPRNFRPMDTPSPVFPVARHGLVLGVARIAASHGGGLLALLSLGGPSWLKRTLSLRSKRSAFWLPTLNGCELRHRVIDLDHCVATLKAL